MARNEIPVIVGDGAKVYVSLSGAESILSAAIAAMSARVCLKACGDYSESYDDLKTEYEEALDDLQEAVEGFAVDLPLERW